MLPNGATSPGFVGQNPGEMGATLAVQARRVPGELEDAGGLQHCDVGAPGTLLSLLQIISLQTTAYWLQSALEEIESQA